ncbi:MAG: hypothetical protein KJO34_18620, partial [Deltaproteobacteria bacterium]|nr:hypothetical protein [Deltaproteobacteria bacterium]
MPEKLIFKRLLSSGLQLIRKKYKNTRQLLEKSESFSPNAFWAMGKPFTDSQRSAQAIPRAERTQFEKLPDPSNNYPIIFSTISAGILTAQRVSSSLVLI